MYLVDFIEKIDKYEWGVVSFNTYYLDKINCCYIMVAERGDNGTFHKRESAITELHSILNKLYLDVRLSATGCIEVCRNCGAEDVISNTCNSCGYFGETNKRQISG